MNDTIILSFFFGIIALGSYISAKTHNKLPKSVMTLALSLFLGVIALKFMNFGTVLNTEQSQMTFLKQFLFLLFICATGYQIGPDIAKINGFSAIRGIFVAFLLAALSFGVATILFHLQWLDISELIGVTAGGVTQTAIIEIAKNSLAEVPEDFNGKVSISFTLSYLASTALTIILCSKLPQWLFRRNLTEDAIAAAETGKEKHPSSKELLLMERQARVFTFSGKSLSIERAANELMPITLQGILSDKNGHPTTLDSGDKIILLADRRQLSKLPSWIGEEVMDIPLELSKQYRYVSQSIRLRRQDACRVGDYFQRCRNLVPHIYIEQITRDKCALHWYDSNEQLMAGDVVKLFCKQDDLQKLDNQVGIVIPKKADTDLVTLGLGIAIGIVVGAASFHGFSLNSGLCVLVAGIVMGLLHDKNPRMAGFPPQAVQLLSDFGLLGFLALSGVGASQTIVDIISSDKGNQIFFSLAKYLGCGLIMTSVPFILTLLAGFFVFRKNIAILAFSLAGSRSSNPAEKELERICDKSTGGQLAGSAFMLPYACANIFLTALGFFIAKLS